METNYISLKMSDSQCLHKWLSDVRKMTRSSKEKDKNEMNFTIDFINRTLRCRVSDPNYTLIMFSEKTFDDLMITDYYDNNLSECTVCLVNIVKFLNCLKNVDTVCEMNITFSEMTYHNAISSSDITCFVSDEIQLKDSVSKVKLLSADIRYQKFFPEDIVQSLLFSMERSSQEMCTDISKDILTRIKNFGTIENERDDLITFKQMNESIRIESKQFELSLPDSPSTGYASFTTKRSYFTDIPTLDYKIKIAEDKLLMSNDINSDIIVIGQYTI